MTKQNLKHKSAFNQTKLVTAKLATLSLIALSLAACQRDHSYNHKLGFLPPIDHDEIHQIVVSKEPTTLAIPVRRGSDSLANRDKDKLARFLGKYKSRRQDEKNSKLFISVPRGSANELSAKKVAEQVRARIEVHGFDETIVKLRPYTAPRHAQPSIRISYVRYVAEGPECGDFPTNLASQLDNHSYENFGCADQKNLAAMVANPADLAEPRTMTPRSETRRRTIWNNYIAGNTTGAGRSSDERVSTNN